MLENSSSTAGRSSEKLASPAKFSGCETAVYEGSAKKKPKINNAAKSKRPLQKSDASGGHVSSAVAARKGYKRDLVVSWFIGGGGGR